VSTEIPTVGVSAEIEYPDQDGLPMSDNTLQFQWIVTIQGNLDAIYRNNQNVFIAGDLLWYAIEGQPKVRNAPDVMVVFGRPKGYRGSYMQWREGGIAPQVVFEVQSPGNRPEDLDLKFAFYERYGVEEYYLYDPHSNTLSGWVRQGASLQPIPYRDGWASPRLGIRFDLSGAEMVIYCPDGQRFLTFVELMEHREEAQRWAEVEHHAREQAQKRAEEAEQRAEVAQRQAEAESEARLEVQRRADALAERLRSLGIDPDQ
jgi:Uma2 family endonuclease